MKSTTNAFVISIGAIVVAVIALMISLGFGARDLVETDQNRNNETQKPVSSIQYKPPPKGRSLTGNLTVYILPVQISIDKPSEDRIDAVLGVIGIIDAAHYTDLGASPNGQYKDETVLLTEQNITSEQRAGGFKAGDRVQMTVYKKPAETVKFYIDPAYTKPDGSPLTRDDLIPYYSFGNGITCCGFDSSVDLGSSSYAGVIIVVDQAYDDYMMQKLEELKKELE